MAAVDRTIDDVNNNDVSDNAEVERLWRSHSANLIAFAAVLVGPHDADDIVVEAVLKALPAIRSGTVRDERAYLVRAVANRARDLHRQRRRRWQRDLAGVGETSTSPPPAHIEVRAAIGKLSLGQRTVVYFIYWEDLTEAHTAELLGISPGTVRQHLVRARRHLRKALQ